MNAVGFSVITPPAVRQAVDLEAALMILGWQAGAPPSITAETQAIDKASCRRLRCPGCRKRGMDYCPMRLGTRYRVIAACPLGGCGAGEVL